MSPANSARDSAYNTLIQVASQSLPKLTILKIDEDDARRLSPSMVGLLRKSSLTEVWVASYSPKPAFEDLRATPPYHNGLTTLHTVMRQDRLLYEKMVFQQYVCPFHMFRMALTDRL